MLPSRLRLTIALNVRRFARVTPADTRLTYPRPHLGQGRVRASSRLQSTLVHRVPVLTRSADVSPPASLDPARWCLGHQLPIKAVLATKLLTALVAGNVAVLFANSVQVIEWLQPRCTACFCRNACRLPWQWQSLVAKPTKNTTRHAPSELQSMPQAPKGGNTQIRDA